ncbi:hypothetical protein E1B28_004045 [Marasmius oreades]|uniref:Uncharacterized protein n=1 Tax=Marasmius oreades TaxID=181124 RepID=A0A9P8ACL3_9AGAR|nr:uncharacterized protein E1B28_004045 [Marasmius oreades]KAG7096628.1 hypothetical protein E1B28_004045 [Marasmius oreades]
MAMNIMRAVRPSNITFQSTRTTPRFRKSIALAGFRLNSDTHAGVTLYVLSNRSQNLLDKSKDPEFLQQVRDVFDLDAKKEFFWERLGKYQVLREF